jgi:endonuclease YncB( thermonuclease family)
MIQTLYIGQRVMAAAIYCKWNNAMLNRIVVLILICLMPIPSLAGVQKHIEVKGYVLNVTSDCLLIVSIDNEATTVQLAGVGYPDDDVYDFKDAREFVRTMAMSRTVRIERIGYRSRVLLGRVYIDNVCLNDALIQAGLAQSE